MRHIGGAARIEEVLAPTPRLAAVGLHLHDHRLRRRRLSGVVQLD
ncbi:hypothetical protein [Verminephrobacter eiseniae]|nr:hypothetical protein [Verminephrobacter eiseniae]